MRRSVVCVCACALFAHWNIRHGLHFICGFRGLLGLPLLARLFACDAQITHLPPHEQYPRAYQYPNLDEFE
jgi:hypothetical protein